MPESLKSPPVEQTEEITAHPWGKKDDRYHQANKIAKEMQENEADQDAGAEGATAAHKLPSDESHRSKDASLPVRTNEDKDRPKESGAASNRQSAGPHVLLVEDNMINQRIVSRKLQAKGFRVTTANHGREAVDTVRHAPTDSSDDKGHFDIILMDQEMPVMDGNAATREIRELEKKGEMKHVSILGVTANVRGEQQDEMVESGMDDVISKPYKIEDMVQKINKALNQKT
ncbi:hypothetical protein B0A55_11995 [Friedmanniomyces simplex]|uniref:Response regulatory domain-containing protein n=1 Tax=Friedmanniomyces simplex TaxID=329884 RepID=A0A4U0VE56_9PEZI|nr:hypothetical protein B0A55_11995 [Friedmanniomyces simplex]